MTAAFHRGLINLCVCSDRFVQAPWWFTHTQPAAGPWEAMAQPCMMLLDFKSTAIIDFLSVLVWKEMFWGRMREKGTHYQMGG